MKDNERKILIANDITGYGRVSTFAMLPIMASYSLHPYVLPTSIVSNTMDYGSCEILDTSDFMKKAISKWDDFGFSFNVISTGFINSAEQVSIISSLIKKHHPSFVMVDPIMADDGKLYPGMYEGAIECNRELISLSSLCIPNLTEAEMLSDLYIGKSELLDKDYEAIIDKFKSLGAKDIVITNCKEPSGKYFNLVYSGNHIEKVYYENVEDKFIGTGDVFSATLLSELLCGSDLINSVKIASKFVREVIIDNKNNLDKNDLIIESSLYRLKKLD